MIREFREGRVMLARLDHGKEIITQIADMAEQRNISTGIFSAIGALSQVKLAFYDQDVHSYRNVSVDRPVEILSCSGNISLRDGHPFVHAHATVADSEGNVMGGHLSEGTVFAAELSVMKLSGEPLIREHDPITDLYLWGDS